MAGWKRRNSWNPLGEFPVCLPSSSCQTPNRSVGRRDKWGQLEPCRKSEVAAIRIKFPTKLPVILERYPKERMLPALNKFKFLVPQDLTMGQFVTIIRNRMSITSTQAFYFLVDGSRSLVNMSSTMAEVYTTYKDEDGFLYMTYASQEMFG
ncbi:microtubule-associated proteins 1A/1B light chain 3C-like [Tiliqua scincoides]|uniref:microtubule-associated proteins 1A/1B light chain 3C-like n=1 Tax=Tiliqua scincoides TaxID=71010 RepID=UPI0034627DCD